MFTLEQFSCLDGITPNSGLIGPNNTFMYIYIYRDKKNIYIYIHYANFNFFLLKPSSVGYQYGMS